jgi:hypothetical protein
MLSCGLVGDEMKYFVHAARQRRDQVVLPQLKNNDQRPLSSPSNPFK